MPDGRQESKRSGGGAKSARSVLALAGLDLGQLVGADTGEIERDRVLVPAGDDRPAAAVEAQPDHRAAEVVVGDLHAGWNRRGVTIAVDGVGRDRGVGELGHHALAVGEYLDPLAED